MNAAFSFMKWLADPALSLGFAKLFGEYFILKIHFSLSLNNCYCSWCLDCIVRTGWSIQKLRPAGGLRRKMPRNHEWL